MKKQKNMSGITLIALIVTIVVLLILAGVTISQITGSDSVIEKARQAKEKTDQASYDEQFDLQSVINELDNLEENTKNFNSDKGVNSPKITKGMIPVKWNGSNWVVCSISDSDWYTYGNTVETKLWANIMLSDGTYKAGIVQDGTVVAEEDLGSMYVWIPRYAYQMPTNAQTTKGTIDVTFLMGNTNKDSSGTTYGKANSTTNTETTKVVHPGFTLGNKELTGIWVAKFEASGTTESGAAVGNASADGKSTTNHPNGEYDPVAADSTTIVRSIPNVPSWRGIRIGDCEWQSMAIAGTNKDQYGLDYCSSHLLKNSEWGAVAYLCYSNYGNVPMKNACGSLTQNKDSNWYYNLYTGQGPASNSSDNGTYNYVDSSTITNHGYTSPNGVLASTTGNVTGIYDMNGGAWEYVAAYLDNKSNNLTYGNNTIESATRYFDLVGTNPNQFELNSGYSELWDKYEVSQEERNDQIDVGAQNAISKSALWSGSTDADSPYTAARYRLTKYIYDNLPKGIGVNEISNTFSFYNVGAGWYAKTGTNSETGEDIYGARTTTAWDNDYVLIGHAFTPFVVRGGSCNYGTSAGVFYSKITYGYGNYDLGFRSALVL